MSRFDSFMNYQVAVVSFLFTAYAYAIANPIDRFWRLVLANISLILVVRFSIYMIINHIYIWVFNDLITCIERLPDNARDNPEVIDILAQRASIRNIRRPREWKETICSSFVRTSSLPFFLITLIPFIWEWISVTVPVDNVHLVVILLDYSWLCWEIWNVLTYDLFQYDKPPSEEIEKIIGQGRPAPLSNQPQAASPMQSSQSAGSAIAH